MNIKLIIGLGNPGPKYKDTYHNAGFLFIDNLIKNLRDSRFDIRISNLLRSNVFMNESGGFVKKMLKKSGAKPEELLVAQDDSDLYIGEYKLAFDRGSAGHKGVQSVIDALGTKKFWRLRLGIRPDIAHRGADHALPKLRWAKAGLPAVARRARAGEFVLKKIRKEDKEKVIKAIERAVVEIFGY
ncbi:MAG: aminoacyl-tRNA hydrolase [Candidatus Liptonbacteria bacterium]|nr:aminoacyl-tRNA hydrolase [Candidatus Liptonbacteria bacterium]